MARRVKIYEGKAKILYEGPEPGTLVQYFKDDATAYNAEKKDVIDGKGVLNNRLSEFFMAGLNEKALGCISACWSCQGSRRCHRRSIFV